MKELLAELNKLNDSAAGSVLLKEAGWRRKAIEDALVKQHIRYLTRQVKILTDLVGPLIEEREALTKVKL